MSLQLVQPKPPIPKQAVIERIKKAPNLDGVWQCPRCGCRTSLTTESGVKTLKGRKQGGTVIVRDGCSECWKQGIHSPMRPEMTVKK